jgi:hypothetical protein
MVMQQKRIFGMKRLRRRIVMFFLALWMPHQAHATDDHPGDYVPLPAGTSALVSYSYYGADQGANIGGTNFSSANTRLQVGTELVRYVHYTRIFDQTVDANLFVPFGGYWNGQIGGFRLNNTFGAFDPILASSIWIIEQANGRYFALTPLVYLPIGSYTAGEVLNPGEHRWRGTLELGWVEPLESKQLTLELNGNISWFGNNNHAGFGRQTLSEQPSYQFQPWLRYNFTPWQALSLGYFGQLGGTQRIDRIPNGFRTDEHAIRLNYQQLVTEQLQLSTTIAHDVAVRGGFRQVFLLDLRFAFVF